MGLKGTLDKRQHPECQTRQVQSSGVPMGVFVANLEFPLLPCVGEWHIQL